MNYNDLTKLKRFALEGKTPSKVELLKAELLRMTNDELFWIYLDSGNCAIAPSPIDSIGEEFDENNHLDLLRMSHNGYIEKDADCYFIEDDCLVALTFDSFCGLYVDIDELAWYLAATKTETSNEDINEILKSNNPDFPMI